MAAISAEDLKKILDQGEEFSNTVPSMNGLRSNIDPKLGPVIARKVKMHIAVVDRSGKLLGMRSMDDAWEGSKDIAIAKARTAAFFSSNENALTSRVIGQLTHITTDENNKNATGPLWGIGQSNQVGITGGPENRNGIITFPGGVPLYKDGVLVGAVGVSGDGVDQDEQVALSAAEGFEPGENVVKLGL